MRRGFLILVALLAGMGAESSARADIGERGDVNLNGVAYEIGDVVLTAGFYTHGAAILDPTLFQFQIAAMDADCDGLTPEIADVVGMVRVVIGLEAPCEGGGKSASSVIASDADTLRIEDVSANPGLTFWLPVYLRNLDTLGAYGIRLAYDTTAIEPVTYVQGSQVRIVHEVVRGTAMESHSGAISMPGIMTFAAIEFTFSAPYLTPGGGVAMRTLWRAKPAAQGQQTQVVVLDHLDFPYAFNTFADLSGVKLIVPVKANGTVTVGTCYCPFQADIDANGVVNAVDLALEIDCVFFCGGSMGPQDPDCPRGRMDFNADGLEDATDLAFMIDHVFFGGSAPVEPCGN
jgi:hypothetical protein